ncbi:syntaxin-8 isoform X1 [Coturnix japonica]|uniref:Syntaxin-8 n=1 Tax=Coturnix japonica TaxID=93934 RepID=A0A8C2UBX0_COTJA|nr:syntaxin-8 isoform X1 [Coturnix japonica]
MAPDPWLSQYDAACQLAQEVAERIQERSRHRRNGESSAKLNVIIRSSLQNLKEKIDQLKDSLLRAVSTHQITRLEGDRRQNLVDDLLTRQKQLQASYKNEGTEPDVIRSSLMAGGVKRGVTNPWLLEESEETRGLGFDEIRQQQRRIIEEQDAGLDALSSIISRQKQMGQEIGNELDEQNEIIDDLTNLVENTDSRLRTQTRHVKMVDRKSTSCDPMKHMGVGAFNNPSRSLVLICVRVANDFHVRAERNAGGDRAAADCHRRGRCLAHQVGGARWELQLSSAESPVLHKAPCASSEPHSVSMKPCPSDVPPLGARLSTLSLPGFHTVGGHSHAMGDVFPVCPLLLGPWVHSVHGCAQSTPTAALLCPGTCAGVCAPISGPRSASFFYTFKLKGRMTYYKSDPGHSHVAKQGENKTLLFCYLCQFDFRLGRASNNYRIKAGPFLYHLSACCQCSHSPHGTQHLGADFGEGVLLPPRGIPQLCDI